MPTDFAYYFGQPDAAHEDSSKIAPNHLSRSYEGLLKAYDRSDGRQIIVGIKGSGKTELRRYLETKKGSAYVFNLDDDHGYLRISAKQVPGRSGRTKNVIALDLVRGFADFVASQSQGKAANLLKSAADNLVAALKKVPEAVEVGGAGVKVNLGKLVQGDHAPVVHVAWKSLVAEVRKGLQYRRGYIMIDDAEDVFEDIEKEPDFLEGVVRAVVDINREAGDRLHVLLFLKFGVYRQWFENQREYDKVAPAILIVSWDHDSLVELIARRIASRETARELDPEAMNPHEIEAWWKKDFVWKGPFTDFSRSITRYCVSGPRDMIQICNMAKGVAKSARIEKKHFESIRKGFSQAKVYEIGADFGDVYPDVHKFVEMVFQSVPWSSSGREVADLIEQRGLLEKRVATSFEEHSWFSARSKERIAAMMYEIGVYGLQLTDGQVVYSLEQPGVTVRDVLDGVLVVHPAFRAHLSVDDPAL